MGYILGVTCYGTHDAAAALIENGNVIAAVEEEGQSPPTQRDTQRDTMPARISEAFLKPARAGKTSEGQNGVKFSRWENFASSRSAGMGKASTVKYVTRLFK